ncbi:MAG: class I SAM-dependent methyltransferase [candidate division WOR-3 bacterium]|nr:class I SAM-dependent methyltransferase [candidate division WOR-3 bacterium]
MKRQRLNKIGRAIEKYFFDRNLDEEAKIYLKYHSKRYSHLLKVASEIRALIPETNIRIMDIGPSFFTELLVKNLPQDSISTLGFDYNKSRGGHFPLSINYDKSSFVNFDLNDAQYPEKLIKIPLCDMVIMAEVIEHLYTAPTLVFNFIKSFLKEDGYLLIQTPNAAALIKRINLLFGKNPYEMIRENRDNPGHFREYTKAELFSIAQKSGFKIIRFIYKNYFNRLSLKEKIYGFILNFLPVSLRDGITIVLQKRPE